MVRKARTTGGAFKGKKCQHSFGFYDKIPRKVFWEKLTRSSFFNIKLGLSHRANLPSAVKDNGDCGEF